MPRTAGSPEAREIDRVVLVLTKHLSYQILMRPRAYHRYARQTAFGLMLLAVLAFVQQGAMIRASEALAWAGVLASPAIELDGPIHIHDGLARHVHMHGGNNGAGHVHQPADHHHDDDADDAGPTMLGTVGCASAVIPVAQTCGVVLAVVSALSAPPQGRLEGIEPDGLNRPPSTPSIA